MPKNRHPYASPEASSGSEGAKKTVGWAFGGVARMRLPKTSAERTHPTHTSAIDSQTPALK